MRIDLVAKNSFFLKKTILLIFFWVWLQTIKSFSLKVSNYPVSLGK